MTFKTEYQNSEPARDEVDSLKGATLIEFGTPWCGHCRAAQPALAEAFVDYPHVEHMKIEDGPGQPLGRSFRVRLWPTLIFLCDGQEMARLVRPREASAIREALEQIAVACEQPKVQSR